MAGLGKKHTTRKFWWHYICIRLAKKIGKPAPTGQSIYTPLFFFFKDFSLGLRTEAILRDVINPFSWCSTSSMPKVVGNFVYWEQRCPTRGIGHHQSKFSRIYPKSSYCRTVFILSVKTSELWPVHCLSLPRLFWLLFPGIFALAAY